MIQSTNLALPSPTMYSRNIALVKSVNSLQLVTGLLHSAFVFETHIRGKTFAKTGLGFQDKVRS